MNTLRKPCGEASRRDYRGRSADPQTQCEPAQHQRDDRQAYPVVKGVKHEIGRIWPPAERMHAVRAYDRATGGVLRQNQSRHQPMQRDLNAGVSQRGRAR